MRSVCTARGDGPALTHSVPLSQVPLTQLALHLTFPGNRPRNLRKRKKRIGHTRARARTPMHTQPWVVILSLIVLAPAVTSAEFFSGTGDLQTLE